MTDLEYLELKKRLENDGYIIKGTETPAQKQHNYFKEASTYVSDQWKKKRITAGYGAMYNNVLNAIKWAYGCRTVSKMPDDKKSEANEIAIQICEMLIKTLEKNQKEDES